MTKSRLIILLAGTAMIAAGSTAHAQHRGGHGGMDGPGSHHRGGHAMMMLRAADANGDNSITRAEFDALHEEMFAWMDRNGDGALDEADQSPVRRRLAAARAEQAEDGEGTHRGRRGGHMGERHMRHDEDGDGRITREEHLASGEAMFERLDGDGDGVVTPDELDAMLEQRQDRRVWWRD